MAAMSNGTSSAASNSTAAPLNGSTPLPSANQTSASSKRDLRQRDARVDDARLFGPRGLQLHDHSSEQRVDWKPECDHREPHNDPNLNDPKHDCKAGRFQFDPIPTIHEQHDRDARRQQLCIARSSGSNHRRSRNTTTGSPTGAPNSTTLAPAGSTPSPQNASTPALTTPQSNVLLANASVPSTTLRPPAPSSTASGGTVTIRNTTLGRLTPMSAQMTMIPPQMLGVSGMTTLSPPTTANPFVSGQLNLVVSPKGTWTSGNQQLTMFSITVANGLSSPVCNVTLQLTSPSTTQIQQIWKLNSINDTAFFPSSNFRLNPSSTFLAGGISTGGLPAFSVTNTKTC
ncbi:hypothetical protein M3Y99_01146600 [Aphelenchoides fujianensis]|nr:hypothetical protein M3Y99_01146600 [Aphelenchoides fujianensis]